MTLPPRQTTNPKPWWWKSRRRKMSYPREKRGVGDLTFFSLVSDTQSDSETSGDFLIYAEKTEEVIRIFFWAVFHLSIHQKECKDLLKCIYPSSKSCVIAHKQEPACWSWVTWIMMNVTSFWFAFSCFSPLIQGPSWFPTFWPSYLLACPCSFWRRLLVSTLLLEDLECGSWPPFSKVNDTFTLRSRP